MCYLPFPENKTLKNRYQLKNISKEIAGWSNVRETCKNTRL